MVSGLKLCAKCVGGEQKTNEIRENILLTMRFNLFVRKIPENFPI
jgi:hypothetical protein